MHIPKTAGTSFISWLKGALDLNTCPDGLWSQLLQRDRDQLTKYSLFAGHFYNSLAEYIGTEVNTITFLRDPISRSISHYRHILNDPHHYFYERVQQQKNFSEFIRDPITQPMVRNFQTRALSHSFKPWLLNKDLLADGTPYFLEKYIETANDNDGTLDSIEVAKKTLDNCLVYGIVEKSISSIEMISNKLGLNYSTVFPNLNTGKGRDVLKSDISSLDMEFLIDILNLDLLLYEYALVNFDISFKKLKS